MRLRQKLVLMFLAALIAIMALLAIAYPPMVDRITKTQLFSLARTVGLYLVHDLEGLAFSGDEAAFERAVDRQFEYVSTLAATTKEFSVRKIILVRPDAKVEIGHPDSEIGQDYSSHADVMEALGGAPAQVVIEAAKAPDGSVETDADIVAPVRLADGDLRAVEIKLDLSSTMALLQSRYRSIQLVVALVILLAFATLSAALLVSVGGTVIRPLLRISSAMEKVGGGDLDVRLGLARRDEMGAMARHFDEMVVGLRERFELTRYVSRSTAGAVRERVEKGRAGKVERRRLVLFFSDVRGFTAYSEKTPPERVIEVLNRLLGLQEGIIAEEGGDVDKFVGDETMAIFQDPAAALRAALRIRDASAAARDDIDGLRLGIGLHVGDLVEGDIGSPTMMDHTVIGDTVNTAARIQSAAGPGQILVSEELAADPGLAASFEFFGSGSISAKGKSQPVQVRGLRGLRKGAPGPA
jgi:adenylate cyclase